MAGVVVVCLGGVLEFVGIFWTERKVLITIQSWLGSRTVNDLEQRQREICSKEDAPQIG